MSLLFLVLWAKLFAISYTNPSPNVPVLNAGIVTHSLFPKVNPVSGEYVEDECDLMIAGCQPLSATRFYHHMAVASLLYALWQVNPETFVKANFEKDGFPFNVLVGERGGGCVLLEGKKENTYVFQRQSHKSFVNTSHGFPSGQTNPKNMKIQYKKRFDPKDGARFAFYGEITDGSGRRLEYETVLHKWHKKIKVKEQEYGPECWTPYYLLLTKERLPNGNVIKYGYTKYFDDSAHPTHYRISTIEALNRDETKQLAFLAFGYPDKGKNSTTEIMIAGSDGRKASCQVEAREIAREEISYWHPTIGKISMGISRSQLFLTKARSPNSPEVKYLYDDHLRIIETQRPEGRVFKTTYNSEGKVAAQYAKMGGDFCCIARFEYENLATSLYDGEENRTRFCFDEHKRLIATEKYQGSQLYSVQKNHWGEESELKYETVEDAYGKIFKKTEYTYDSRGNVLEERVSGMGSPGYTIRRTYSDDGFNLKLSEDDGSVCTTYAYFPGTNLCTEEKIHDGSLKRKISRKYDDCGVCIEEREEDSTYVKIKRVKPRQDKTISMGQAYRNLIDEGKRDKGSAIQALGQAKSTYFGVGLPEVVEEWTMVHGKEILLGKVVYSYTPFGKVSQEDHYDRDNTLRYSLKNEYDDRERLKSHTNALGHSVTYTYDANNNVITESGPRPDMFKRVTYDTMNRPIQIEERQSDGTFLNVFKSYDHSGRVTESIDPSGFKTRFEYDSLGRVIHVIHPDGSSSTKEYDILGNVTKERDECGNEKRVEYDYHNQPIKIEYPDGSKERFFYNGNGTLKEHHDRNGAVVLYEYDGFKRPISTRFYGEGKLLKETKGVYSSYNLELSVDGEGNVTRYTYDTIGRKIEEESGGKKTSYFYDPLGRLAKQVVGDIAYVESFDVGNQLIEKRVESKGKILRREAYHYDQAGNKIKVERAKGGVAIEYNAQGLPVLKTDGLGHQTHYSYKYFGGFSKSEINPRGIESQVFYDSRGREKKSLIKKEAQIIQKRTKKYDPVGNLLEEEHSVFEGDKKLRTYVNRWRYRGNLVEALIEGDQKETRYSYDSSGRIEKITRPSGQVLFHTYDVFGKLKQFYSNDFHYEYTYDRNGHVTKVLDKKSHTTTERVYDALGNILQEVLANGLVVHNTYDSIGRRKELILPDATQVSFEYEGDKISSIARGNLTTRYISRDLDGSLRKMMLPDGIEVKYERDGNGRMWLIDSAYYKAELFYDGVGNLEYSQYTDMEGKKECLYEYDGLNQLTKEDESRYRYDSLNNRLAKGDKSYKINNLNQIESDGKTNYCYDLNGNLIDDGDKRYTYDAQDRLIRIQGEGLDIEYGYDAFHRRISKKAKGIEEKFLWDGENEIGKVIGDELKELRVLGEGLGAEIGATVLMELSGHKYVPIHDHRGCLIFLKEIGGTYKEGCRYTAFGERADKKYISPWGFAGKRYDLETGFIYFGRRYYDPDTGRWVTPDPLGFKDGPNLYAYVHNSPLSHVDLYGLYAEATKRRRVHAYPSFEDHLKVKSHSYDTKRSKKLPLGEMWFMNGIRNPFSACFDKACMLSDMSGGYNWNGIYNAIRDPVGSLYGSSLSLIGMRLPPADRMLEKANYFFDHSPPGIPLFIIAHSEACLHIERMTEQLPEDRRQRLHLVLVAPAAYIPKEKVGYVRHYVSECDIVPGFDLVDRGRCKDTTTVLKRHPRANTFFDHDFCSPTYRDAIQAEIDKYLNEIKKYEN